MAVNRRKTKEQQCEPGFHLRPAFPEEAGLFHALTPEEDEAQETASHDQQLWQEDHPVGKIAFASGEEEIFTDPQKYLDAVRCSTVPDAPSCATSPIPTLNPVLPGFR